MVGTLVIENATFLTQDPAAPVVKGNLVARDGVIAAVGPGVRADDAEDVIDAAGGIVTPGFVNAHTHAAMTLMRGAANDLPLERWLKEAVWPREARLDARAVAAGSELAVMEMLAAGVTAFNDMYFFADETARAAERFGIRAALATVFIDFPTPELQPDSMPGAARAFHAAWRDHPLVAPGLAAHGAYTCGPDTLRTVAALRAELAGDAAAPLFTAHCAETLAEVQDVLAGPHAARPLAAFAHHGLVGPGTVFAHCGWCTKDEVRKLGQAGAAVAHCPVSNMKLATGGYLPLPELLDADVPVGLGTDGAASNNTLDVLETAKFAALVQMQHRWDATALTAPRALALATRDGARAIGFPNAGVIAPGRAADLAVFTTDRPGLRPVADPFSLIVHAARGTDVRATVVAGRIVYEDGAFPGIDAAEVVANAEKEAARVAGA